MLMVKSTMSMEHYILVGDFMFSYGVTNKHEFKNAEELYFLTSDNKMKTYDWIKLYPRIPRRRLPYENCNIRRICVNNKIYRILKAIPCGFGPNSESKRTFAVFKLIKFNKNLVMEPTNRLVPDAKFTKELWCLGPVEAKKVGTLMVDEADLLNFYWRDFGGHKHLFNTRNNIKWHWIEKPKEKVRI